MDINVLEMVQKLLFVVTFIAIGGLMSIVFFFIFGHSILGITRLQHQITSLEKATRDTNNLLESIEDKIKNHKDQAQ